jgi:hypothetical protein
VKAGLAKDWGNWWERLDGMDKKIRRVASGDVELGQGLRFMGLRPQPFDGNRFEIYDEGGKFI